MIADISRCSFKEMESPITEVH